jgi:hypothetical protein
MVMSWAITRFASEHLGTDGGADVESNFLSRFRRYREHTNAGYWFTLTQAGFDMKTLSVVGQGFHTEEKVLGFYNTGDRVKFWGTRGAYWGAFWGIFLSGVHVATPVVGTVIVLGYLTAAVISAIEGVIVFGGLSAIGAALYSIGIPKNSVVDYEAAVKADNFLVLAHGATADMARAKAILSPANALRVESHGRAIVPALARAGLAVASGAVPG